MADFLAYQTAYPGLMVAAWKISVPFEERLDYFLDHKIPLLDIKGKTVELKIRTKRYLEWCLMLGKEYSDMCFSLLIRKVAFLCRFDGMRLWLLAFLSW